MPVGKMWIAACAHSQDDEPDHQCTASLQFEGSLPPERVYYGLINEGWQVRQDHRKQPVEAWCPKHWIKGPNAPPHTYESLRRRNEILGTKSDHPLSGLLDIKDPKQLSDE